MAKITSPSRLSIRAEAERFLALYGFSAPPLLADQALAARELTVTQYSLDDLLVKAHLPPEDHQKIQAMLDTQAGTVTFRNGLPVNKKKWGSLHEVGHEFISWQRDLLYYCPLLMLPIHVQDEFEAEADAFAAEAFFFGNQFHGLASDGDLSLNTAIELAEDVYQTSFHATFTHYVKESSLPCCLLVWQPRKANGSPWVSEELALHYYVKSQSFQGHIDPGQLADPDEAVVKIFTDPSLEGVVKHEMNLVDKSGQVYTIKAESFSNSYNVFTLISQPKQMLAQ